jgi:secondary thiamine-phosphate synthase enzyme
VARIEVVTSQREELVDITAPLARALTALGITEGAVLVYCPHTTAAITINENADPAVVQDLLAGLARVSPRDAGWSHMEGNSDGHLKSSLVGASELIPVSAGRLALGTWQGVYFCEFDGPRRRHVFVHALGDGASEPLS